MSDIERQRETPYVMVNRNLVRDKSISFKCRAFIIYCLSFDPSWKISMPYFMREQGISKDQLYSCINEAIASGYMKREETLVLGLKRYKYFVSEEPKFIKPIKEPEKHMSDLEEMKPV